MDAATTGLPRVAPGPAVGLVPPIADYGLIGDTRTAALSSSRGSVDWMCAPRFDSPPIFGRLVGGDAAGCFAFGPATPTMVVTQRRYQPGSAVLETTWEGAGAHLTLTEGFVANVDGALLPATLLVRRLACRGGPATVRVRFEPRIGSRHVVPRTESRAGLVVCRHRGLALSLRLDGDLVVAPGEGGEVTMRPGETLTALLAVADREPLIDVPPAAAWTELTRTDRWWRTWSDELTYDGPASAEVARSLLTLRLLTYSPSGAPVAAPTTSLPEDVGGERNWDYRFSWPRDASIGIAAFLGLGKTDEARAFLYWLLHASRLQRPHLPALLTIDGRRVPAEQVPDGWSGYRASRPVRFGNGARDQHQLDGYGWLLDGAWQLVRAGHHLYGETWRALSAFTDFAATHWADPDAGIWEVRGPPRHYVHSKLMAWLALDRGLRIAATHRLARRRRDRWQRARTELSHAILTRGVDPIRPAFVRAFGDPELDSALLLCPVVDLLDPDSPVVVGTVDAIRRELSDGPFVYRYPPGHDGLPGGEGAFLPCSFWLVQALARTGRPDEAEALFSDLVAAGSPLGLYPEEIDPRSGEHLGNYPQALTHAALVQAALALRDARERAAAPGARRTRRAR